MYYRISACIDWYVFKLFSYAVLTSHKHATTVSLLLVSRNILKTYHIFVIVGFNHNILFLQIWFWLLLNLYNNELY